MTVGSSHESNFSPNIQLPHLIAASFIILSRIIFCFHKHTCHSQIGQKSQEALKYFASESLQLNKPKKDCWSIFCWLKACNNSEIRDDSFLYSARIKIDICFHIKIKLDIDQGLAKLL